MKIKVFYSWQSDLPNNTNRGFIQDVLEKAVKNISKNDSIDVIPKIDIDKDTQGVSGTPSIPETILKKIDESDIFVCDISIINKNSKTRRMPNPNVLFELGYALKSLGWDKVLMICNISFGKIADLPFDLDRRRVISYSVCKDDANKSDERNRLAKVLQGQIESILKFTIQDISTLSESETVDTFISEMKKIADEKKLKEQREQWAFSLKSVDDVINEVTNIFRKIDKYLDDNQELFSELEINGRKFNNAREIENIDFASQVKLHGNESNYKPINIKNSQLLLSLTLFKKSYVYNNHFTKEGILNNSFSYKPELDNNLIIVWREIQNKSQTLTSEELVNKFFKLLTDNNTTSDLSKGQWKMGKRQIR